MGGRSIQTAPTGSQPTPTWLTAVMDVRVTAIIPAVIDVLNMDEQMAHHHSVYGFYSSAVHDYADMRVFERLDTREGQKLLRIVDPYAYRKRLRMPKYLINSTGDQFFVPDSAQFYFDDLRGDKYLRYVPNTDHGLGDSDAWESLMIFYLSVVNGAERPRFSWRVARDGAIHVQTTDTPEAVNLWQATATDARDFRLETIGKAWTSTPLASDRNGVYVARVPTPEKGWTAYFVELVFDSGASVPHKFTTEVRVTPNVAPFPPSPAN